MRPAGDDNLLLVVSEDPDFIVEVQRRLRARGAVVLGCVGPANTPCGPSGPERCSFADHVEAILIDCPPEGEFTLGSRRISVGPYSERLAEAHPETFVVLAGAEEGRAGASGDVVHAGDREQGIELLEIKVALTNGLALTGHPAL